MEIWFEGMVFAAAETVYLPAEDSFLLAKYAKTAEGRALDVGTGCGICAIVSAKSGAREVVGIDINPDAIEVAKENAKRNSAKCGFLVSDLFSKVKGKFDTIIFNPPYLPTKKGETLSGAENLAYDGGRSGRKVIDRFLAQFPKHLAPGGRLLMLDSSLDNTEKTLKALEKLGFKAKILEKERFFFEELSVVEARGQ